MIFPFFPHFFAQFAPFLLSNSNEIIKCHFVIVMTQNMFWFKKRLFPLPVTLRPVLLSRMATYSFTPHFTQQIALLCLLDLYICIFGRSTPLHQLFGFYKSAIQGRVCYCFEEQLRLRSAWSYFTSLRLLSPQVYIIVVPISSYSFYKSIRTFSNWDGCVIVLENN